MKRVLIIAALIIILGSFTAAPALAQCSVCTRTAQQMGEKPARGLNTGILYLAFTPLVVAGFIGYRWWRNKGHN